MLDSSIFAATGAAGYNRHKIRKFQLVTEVEVASCDAFGVSGTV